MPDCAANGVRIGIVCMVKAPRHIETWLEWYHERIGVERFYIYIDCTPQLAAIFNQQPWAECVLPTYNDFARQRNYFGLRDRQVQHINATIPRARAVGLTHLLHIDDDELLYCHRGVGALRAELAAATTVSVHLHNLEALYPSAECADPFRETCAFRHRPPAFAAYSNGKSFGALRFSRLAPHGAHTPHAHATAS